MLALTPVRNEPDNRSSMLYWFPRIKDLPIPQSRTIVIPVDVIALLHFCDGNDETLKPFLPQLETAGIEIGYPLFLRTDILSAKHDWEYTCYVKHKEDLLRHIGGLASVNFGIFGPDPSAIIFREYIPLASRFTAFMGNMPVAPERRYFVRDGVVECHHPYQPPDSIWGASTPDWHDLLDEMNRQPGREALFLTGYAQQAGKMLEGYWSVDFALAADGRWLLIDCAEGEKSYHWKECEHAATE